MRSAVDAVPAVYAGQNTGHVIVTDIDTESFNWVYQHQKSRELASNIYLFGGISDKPSNRLTIKCAYMPIELHLLFFNLHKIAFLVSVFQTVKTKYLIAPGENLLYIGREVLYGKSLNDLKWTIYKAILDIQLTFSLLLHKHSVQFCINCKIYTLSGQFRYLHIPFIPHIYSVPF